MADEARIRARAGPRTAQGVRQPFAAGRFYPSEPERLLRAVESYLGEARPARSERPIALLSPHAGYIYSGQIAADAYRQAAEHDYDTIVILGTNHTAPRIEGASVSAAPGYRTPMGIVETDTGLSRTLLEAEGEFHFEAAAHEGEHSVEVQLPFIQHMFPGVPVVAILVGSSELGFCARAGRVLADAVRGRRTLLVASSDLSHYPSYENACAVDRRTLIAMARLDPGELQAVTREQLHRGVPELSTCVCGEAPVLVTMIAARALGAGRGVVISYGNSGDSVVGTPSRVVGYGALAWSPGAPGYDAKALEAQEEDGPHGPDWGSAADAEALPILSTPEKKYLLELARETIRRYLDSETAPLPRDLSPALRRCKGAYVTLKKGGELRGCLGHMIEDVPLGRIVGNLALQTAFGDPRFPPVQADELPEVEIEISILTPLHRVAGPEAIVPGRDGVLLRKEGRSATFLPQVAAERGWSRETMLDQLCRKAGLPAGSWRRGAELSTFRALVIRDSELA